MLKRWISVLAGNTEFTEIKEEINRENRSAVRFLACSGLLISIANIAAQSIVHGVYVPPAYSYILPACFLILLIIERTVMNDRFRHSLAVLYIAESVILAVAIALGTFLDPTHEAITILLMMVSVPVFILDRPLRSISVLTGWSVIFLILSAVYKERSLFLIDAIHVLEFYIVAVILLTTVTWLRLQYLIKLKEIRYSVDHDAQTGCYTRQYFHSHLQNCMYTPVTFMAVELPDLMMYGDFYGHDHANEMTLYLTLLLTDSFGEENIFRYRGNEFLCVMREINEEKLNGILSACRARLKDYEIEGRKCPLNLSAGYVYGTARSETEVSEMVQLADIYLHKAETLGENQTSGGMFDQERLRVGIVQSNLSFHARPYEINSLTGLPGMSYFKIHTEELLTTVVDLDQHPVIGYLKLMRLRHFNSEFGYAGGDMLISDTAKLISQAFENRVVCYITGGKFCVMCYRDEVVPAMEVINEVLSAYKPGALIYVNGGFCEYTRGQSVISLLDQAKTAENTLRKKKEHFCFYDAQMDEESRFRQYIIDHVDEAIEMEYLKVYYQPIARALTGHICNEEALVRWDDPRYGFLMPFRFVKLLEENALMYKVNLYVISKVLEGFKLRRELGVPIVPVSVNLSRTDFEQCDMVTGISALVDAAGVPRHMLKLEITESAFIADQDLLKKEVQRFRENGFEVWLDDFGSEYSTLNLLQEIDFDLLKIDMQFMKNFSTEGKNFIIISDIIDMAKQMGITTLIEGVETEEHYQVLQKLGCEKIQGYLFNRPNSQEYIIERARSGTGLVFEDPEAAPYYDAIGRLDLKKPALRASAEEFGSEQGVASAIVEWDRKTFSCLASTEPFRRIMHSLHTLPDDANEAVLQNVPEAMVSAAQLLDETGSRRNFDVDSGGRRYTFYLRRITSREYRGSIALLIIIMQNLSETSV